MPISEATIKDSVERYRREYDRYLKLAARVAEICRQEIVEGNAIRAQVTSRAKTAKSLEGKLRRLGNERGRDFPNVDVVFDQIRDLAAVRVATYEQQSEPQVVEHILRRFTGLNAAAAVVDVKDRNREDSSKFYRATHCEVVLTKPDLVGTYENVENVPCEIQVCSMMAHVWNEIEHDLAYKPLSGELSDEEKRLLVTLGHASRGGDMTISSLLEATDKRQREFVGSFSDVYDFVARIRRWFPGVEFGKNAGQLFEELQLLRILTPASIERLIGGPAGVVDGAATELRRLSAQFRSGGHERFALDENSSDLLLVLMLPHVAQHIVKNHALGRGGGVRRTAWIAERYLEAGAAAEK